MDVDFLAELNSDTHVMAHVSGRPAGRSETEEEWAQPLSQRSDAENGLGYWVGCVEGQPIGWWALGRTEAEPSAGELDFRIRPTHWRQGSGVGGARMLLDHAYDDWALVRI